MAEGDKGSGSTEQGKKVGGPDDGKILDVVQGAFWFPFFAFSSVSMVVLNKYCATSFDQPYSLLGFQNSMTILLNLLGVQIGVFKAKPFDYAQFRMFFLPTFLFIGMLISSLKGLPFVSVATTVVFRAISTCLVAVGDFIFFKKRFLMAECICLVVLVLGAVLYAFADLQYDATGYAWMVCNTAFFVSSQLYEKYAIVSLDQTAVGISCVQNAMSLPILLFFGGFVFPEEPLAKLRKLDSATHFFLFSTGIAGCALSVCYMSLSKFASATSISLAGNLNKLLSILVGAVVFGNPLSLLQGVGLGVCLLAAMAFAQKGAMPVPSRASSRVGLGLSVLAALGLAANFALVRPRYPNTALRPAALLASRGAGVAAKQKRLQARADSEEQERGGGAAAAERVRLPPS